MLTARADRIGRRIDGGCAARLRDRAAALRQAGADGPVAAASPWEAAILRDGGRHGTGRGHGSSGIHLCSLERQLARRRRTSRSS
ncbi:MAG: hypothetical protein MZV49_20915 [Rhodopseudomonas palustris]|nr:hypothetical protein [Rhodopseudomonas palustris]